MAEFEISYQLTKSFEIGYSIDPDDRGGETYNGISRVNNPGWDGWPIIDEMKSKGFKLDNLKHHGQLDLLADLFYKIKHWNAIRGDEITYQELANELFDNAVNMGNERSIEYLQRALNILNRNEDKKYYKDLLVDRNFGPATMAALNIALQRNAKLLLNVINGFQVKHYIEIMEKNPTQEKYIGWFRRVVIHWG